MFIKFKEKKTDVPFILPCSHLLLLRKEQYRIHMPRGFMDDLEGEVVDEKVHEGGLGKDILSADLDGEDAFLLNIRVDCVFGVYFENMRRNFKGKPLTSIIVRLIYRNPLEDFQILCYNVSRKVCGCPCHAATGATQTGAHF